MSAEKQLKIRNAKKKIRKILDLGRRLHYVGIQSSFVLYF